MAVTEIGRRFNLNNQIWEVDEKGNWKVQIWGWFPFGHSPRYDWKYVEYNDIPKELKNIK